MAGTTVSSHHPTHPPKGEEDRLIWLRLLRSRRVGTATFWRLLGEHGSAEAALAALPAIARAAGVSDYSPCPPAVAQAELRAGRQAGARLLMCGGPAYPAALAQLDDPPPLLWTLGDVALLARPAVAVVGARNASSLGLRMARLLAAGLGAEGLTVVSGLARGVDAAAHQGALESGTVAVMAGGVDRIFPSENSALGQQIGQRGLLVSEQPMGLVPQARHFPRRNRIIAGLARALVVVEAAARSGSLITAREALEIGREVMAVPGHPLDPRASGCNMLLRDGALLVRGAEDVLEALAGQPLEPAPAAPEPAGWSDPGWSDPGRSDPGRLDPGPARGNRPARAAQGPDRRPPEVSPRHAATGRPPPAPSGPPAAPPASAFQPAPPAQPTPAWHRASAAAGSASPPDHGTAAPPPRAPDPAGCGAQAAPRHSPAETAALHERILARLSPAPISEDALIRDLGAKASEVGQELVCLELDGHIERRPGGMVALAV